MRVDPHILTEARASLVRDGIVVEHSAGIPFFHLASANPTIVTNKVKVLNGLHTLTNTQPFTIRLGQALEIAVFRALCEQGEKERNFRSFGGFADLDAHDDSGPYKQEPPPSSVGNRRINGSLDFMLIHGNQLAAIEVKNVRPWLYPDHDHIRELVQKAVLLDAVPVLIARRIPYVSFKLLHACGVIVHQTYFQRFPVADADLAERVKDKKLLGYHDIRLGNAPDARLRKFIGVNLPAVLPDARIRFDNHKTLLQEFAQGLSSKDFASELRRRTAELDDPDWP